MERGQINDSDVKINAVTQYYENPCNNFYDKYEYGQTDKEIDTTPFNVSPVADREGGVRLSGFPLTAR